MRAGAIRTVPRASSAAVDPSEDVEAAKKRRASAPKRGAKRAFKGESSWSQPQRNHKIKLRPTIIKERRRSIMESRAPGERATDDGAIECELSGALGSETNDWR